MLWLIGCRVWFLQHRGLSFCKPGRKDLQVKQGHLQTTSGVFFFLEIFGPCWSSETHLENPWLSRMFIDWFIPFIYRSYLLVSGTLAGCYPLKATLNNQDIYFFFKKKPHSPYNHIFERGGSTSILACWYCCTTTPSSPSQQGWAGMVLHICSG